MVDRTVMQSGRYKAYPKYKDSGAEWLGKIPNGWEVLPIKYVANVNMGQSPSSDDVNDSRVGLPFLQGNADFSKFSPKARTWCPVPRKIAKKGEVLFSVRAPVGAVNVADMDYGIGRGLCSIKGNDSLAQDFLAWLLPSYKYQFDAVSTGSTFESVSSEEVNNLLFSLPSLNEQKKIANFLDYETAKIDTLIEKQQHLIELLTEKRQAVISHAVTKGLNPDVPMKDSGVEWLGEVPEHWEVKRFKTIFKIRKRIAGELGHDVLSITQKGIKIKDTESGEGQLSMDYSKYQLVYKGDYAMNHMDLLTGFVDISKYDGVTSPDYRVFTLEEKNSLPEYFLAFLQMGYINKLFFPFGQGAAHMGRWRLPTEAFREFLAPVPPKNEQKAIADFIFNSLEQMDILEKKSRKAIKLMQERRTALISAAVMGKIDVRDWVKPE